MKDPDPRFEKKVLLEVVEQMEHSEATWRRQVVLRRVIMGTGYVALLAALMLALHEMTHPFLAALLAAAAGCGLGFGIFLEFSLKQWPVTRKHIDMNSVRRRIHELESGMPDGAGA